jgi:hypothetical protein
MQNGDSFHVTIIFQKSFHFLSPQVVQHQNLVELKVNNRINAQTKNNEEI